MDTSLRVVLYGVGEMGHIIARVAFERGLNIVGAIDVDPWKCGKKLGELVGLGDDLDVIVSRDAEKTLSECRPDVVLHATTSFLDQVYPQLIKCARVGADVVSTCETLVYPYYRYPELAELLDEYAKNRGVSFLGTGVNPGFLLDVLPAVLTAGMTRVERIKATRIIDASKKRRSFRRKIGLNLSLEEFEREAFRGGVTGHVGYAESVMLLASIMGVDISRVEEFEKPIIAEEDFEFGDFRVGKGRVAGIEGVGRGFIGDGEPFIEVRFVARVGAEEYEEIVVDGVPRVVWRSTGVDGDLATAGIVVNMAMKIVDAPPGLLTMGEMFPSYVSSRHGLKRRMVF